jgi:hypothetical protein
MLNNPLCVKDGRFLYPIGTRGTTREKKSRRDQSHEEKTTVTDPSRNDLSLQVLE